MHAWRRVSKRVFQRQDERSGRRVAGSSATGAAIDRGERIVTKATRAGLVAAGGALAAWLAMAGPPPSGLLGERAQSGAGVAQGIPIAWTRASGPGRCLPEGAARHVEAYLAGRGQGSVWVRYDDAIQGIAGGGGVLRIDLSPAVQARYAEVAAAVEKEYPNIQAGRWTDLRDLWAVTADATGAPTAAWHGARAWDGRRWWAAPAPIPAEGATETLGHVSVSDKGGHVWVPFQANYGCPPSAPNCQQSGVKAVQLDPRAGVTTTGAVILPTIAADAARYGIPDALLVPGLAQGDAWVVGHGGVYVLPFHPLRGRPVDLPVVDAAAGIGGYATAATRDLKGRLVIALWTEQRGPNGLQHAIAVHALDGAEWAVGALELTRSPLFERGAGYDRVTGLALDPNGTSLWAISFGGAVLEVDASVFLRPQWLTFASRNQIGLAQGERILDISVVGSGDNRLVVLGTTNGVIASRDVCPGAPPASNTPGSTLPTTDTPRESATPTPTDAAQPTATPTETAETRATPTPSIDPGATATPTPTDRPLPPLRPAYIPFAVGQGALTDGPTPLDVVWLIDRSASMYGAFASDRTAKLAAVVGALGPRVRALPAGDQAAIIAFDEPTQVLAPLSRDEGALAAALGALVDSDTADGSRLDLGLTVARRELAGPTRRPGVLAAVVVLSDGTSTRAPTADDVAKAADPLRRAGVAVWAVGLGPDVDTAWLAAAAGEARVLRAGDPPELDAALNRIDRALRAGR